MFLLQVILFFGLAKSIIVKGAPNGFHYVKFYGPIFGPENEIENDGHSNYQFSNYESNYVSNYESNFESDFDHFAKPDYTFAYGVQDPITGNYQNQRETRNGEVVRGEYSVMEPDGSIRKVVYTADAKNGFQATVHMIKPSEAQKKFLFQSLNRSS